MNVCRDVRSRRDRQDPADPKTAPPPRLDSEVLLDESGRLLIEHHGKRYLLRTTRAGKLILTRDETDPQ